MISETYHKLHKLRKIFIKHKTDLSTDGHHASKKCEASIYFGRLHDKKLAVKVEVEFDEELGAPMVKTTFGKSCSVDKFKFEKE